MNRHSSNIFVHQSVSRPKDSIPMRLYIGTSIITTIILLVFCAYIWKTYNDFKTIKDQDLRLKELSGAITYLNEISTMLVGMAIETGDLKLEKRYQKYDSQLDSVVNEAKTIVPDIIKEAQTQTDVAHMKLQEMEKESFRLLHEGKRDSANFLFFGPQYDEEKIVYKKSNERIAASLSNRTEAVLLGHHRAGLLAIVITIISIPVLLFVWIGAVRRMKVYLRDRNQAEQALMQTSERLNEAQCLAHMGNWELNLTSNVLTWSDEIYRIFEIAPIKFGASYEAFLDAVHPDDREAVNFAYTNSLKTRTPYAIDHRLCFSDGRIKYVHEQCETFYDNDKPIRSIGTVQDITERKLAEENIRIANAYNRSLIEVSLDPLVTISPEGKITDVNHATETVTGYPRSELIGTDFSDYFIDPETARTGYRKVFELGYVTDYPLEIKHKDGEITPVLYNAAIYRDEKEKVIGIFAAARDVTELKRIENDIRNLNAELEQRVKDRTRQLEATNKELESFAYSVSHDLRAPLRSIDGFSQVFLEEYQEKIDTQGKNYLQRVRSAAQQMAQLIDDILNLSRVTRDKMNIHSVNLSVMAKDIADNLYKLQPDRHVEFIIQTNIVVKGDGHLLRIVLENLLDNAWKFTSKHNKARIEFGIQQQKDRSAYFVRDDGAGFNMNYAQKLFGAFQRLHTINEFPGTGVGLATVQRVIHRHGGEVWAEGEVEKGATFYFTIP